MSVHGALWLLFLSFQPLGGARALGIMARIASLCVFFPPPCPWPDLQTEVWLVINLSFVCVFFYFSLSCGCWALREQREVSQQRLLLERESVCVRDAVAWSGVKCFGGYCIAKDPWGVSECIYFYVCMLVFILVCFCLLLVMHLTAWTLFYCCVSVSFADFSSFIQKVIIGICKATKLGTNKTEPNML